MKTITLFIITIMLNVLLTGAQNGDTINQAIEIEGTGYDIDILDFNSASASGLLPTCGSNQDVFYKHTTSPGDNKMTIGMISTGLALFTNIEYQIFQVTGGLMENLQPLNCGDYDIFALAGGSFEYVIEDIEEVNTYYLRVYKKSQFGINLSSLLGGTSITMRSDFDETLSIDDLALKELKFVVNNERLKLLNNINYNQFSIYDLSGREVLKDVNNEALNTIDISQLNKGIYVINLKANTGNKTYKFLKQ